MKHLFLFILTLGLCGCESKLTKDNRVMMGTFVEVTSPDKHASEIVFSEIQRMEELMSKYQPGSEISKLNAAGSLKTCPEMIDIVQRSIALWQKTGKTFDITVAPLVDLWGFTEKTFRVPADKEIKTCMKSIGSDKITVNNTTGTIQFTAAKMKIDLGGIAKGYALDRAVEELKKAGINNCLINIGGQVYALGVKRPAPAFNPFRLKKEEPWTIAVKSSRGETMSAALTLRDQSMATSGDYEQFFVHNGTRFAHIIDPRIGMPAVSGVKSVTIIALDGTTADALSTACFVLGKTEAEKMIKQFEGARIEVIETE